jgi:hypothetical protein
LLSAQYHLQISVIVYYENGRWNSKTLDIRTELAKQLSLSPFHFLRILYLQCSRKVQYGIVLILCSLERNTRIYFEATNTTTATLKLSRIEAAAY